MSCVHSDRNEGTTYRIVYCKLLSRPSLSLCFSLLAFIFPMPVKWQELELIKRTVAITNQDVVAQEDALLIPLHSDECSLIFPVLLSSSLRLPYHLNRSGAEKLNFHRHCRYTEWHKKFIFEEPRNTSCLMTFLR